MEIIRMKPKILSQKIIAHVSKEYARTYHLPEDHQSVAFFSVDYDDVAYLAVDDATKKANIKVIHAATYYGGYSCSWSKFGGSVYVMFSGPKVADVRSGLNYVNDFVENQSGLYNFDGDESLSFYVQCIPRAGKYSRDLWGIEEGSAYTYMVGGPIETNYAIDKALKASETRVVNYWYPPSHANSSGAVLAGSESACRSARDAFLDALKYATENPLKY